MRNLSFKGRCISLGSWKKRLPPFSRYHAEPGVTFTISCAKQTNQLASCNWPIMLPGNYIHNSWDFPYCYFKVQFGAKTFWNPFVTLWCLCCLTDMILGFLSRNAIITLINQNHEYRKYWDWNNY